MADPLSFEALASSEHVLSSAENFVLYVLLEAVARGAGRAPENIVSVLTGQRPNNYGIAAEGGWFISTGFVF